jgi:hypothetical protein
MHGINTEVSKYLSVSAEEVQQQAQAIFRPENASILMYKSKEGGYSCWIEQKHLSS